MDFTGAISTWLMENALLLHPGKTKMVMFGTQQRLVGLDTTGGVNIAVSTEQVNDALKLLSVTLDALLSFASMCRTHLHFPHACVRHIRPLLTLEAAKALLLCPF